MSEKTTEYLVDRIRVLEEKIHAMKLHPMLWLYRGLNEYQLNRIIDYWIANNKEWPPKGS